MLMDGTTLRSIVDGDVTLQFRRWKRPTVKPGGTLLTSVGLLAIEAVDPVAPDEISEDDAQAAGFAGREALLRVVDERGPEGRLFRIALRYAGPDPRIELRASIPDSNEMMTIVRRLRRWDARSPGGAWTRRALEVIGARPETRAADLAGSLDMEKARFKANVRKLKGLGLTESLEMGYRLSPRGCAVLEQLEGAGDGES